MSMGMLSVMFRQYCCRGISLHIGVGSALFASTKWAMRRPRDVKQATDTDTHVFFFYRFVLLMGVGRTVIIMEPKKFFFTVATVLCSLSITAQTTTIATLSHEGSVRTFYSATALRQAYEAAEEGDIITLSSGKFHTIDQLSKKLTIRGAGMMLSADPTILSGVTKINIPNNDSNNALHLYIEGICFSDQVTVGTVYNMSLQKCMFISKIDYSDYTDVVSDCQISDCIISKSINLPTNAFNVCFNNSYVSSVGTSSQQKDASYLFRNCTISDNSKLFSSFNHSDFKNCLFYNLGSSPRLENYSTASGCYYIGNSNSFFNSSLFTTNHILSESTPIFKEDSETFELLDENAISWLGDDGTQVGMHGGDLPFSPETYGPKIVKFNVAAKSTADGKLPVEIEVKVK